MRRISLRVDIEVPERDRKRVGGVTSASVRLSAQLADVGGDQRVEAPRSSRPLSDLTNQLGSLRNLTDGLGGGSAHDDHADARRERRLRGPAATDSRSYAPVSTRPIPTTRPRSLTAARCCR